MAVSQLSPAHLGVAAHLTVLCSHVGGHVRLGDWLLADGAHANVPLAVDFMDGKIKHRDFLFATETEEKGKDYYVILAFSHAVQSHGHVLSVFCP